MRFQADFPPAVSLWDLWPFKLSVNVVKRHCWAKIKSISNGRES